MVREDWRPPPLPPFLYGPATLYRREKNLKEILSPSLFLPALNKNESQSVLVNNVTSVEMILYLIINLSLRLQVEGTVLGVACLVTG